MFYRKVSICTGINLTSMGTQCRSSSLRGYLLLLIICSLPFILIFRRRGYIINMSNSKIVDHSSYDLGNSSTRSTAESNDTDNIEFINNYTTKTNDTQTSASTSTIVNSTTNDTTSVGSVKFIPYPHKTLGSGATMQCEWRTIPLNETNHTYDLTQKLALSEGVCIPPTISIHIFSSNEARECLSSKRIIISGDSYSKQLFIGLADILLAKHVGKGIEMCDSKVRTRIKDIANSVLAKRHDTDPSFPRAQFKCEKECYGKVHPFEDMCSECINSYTNKDNNTIAVVGAGIHFGDRVRRINKFLDLSNKTIYVPMPHSPIDLVSKEYKANAPQKNAMKESVYNALLPNLAPINPQHPFLDTYQLTRSCTMANCSCDGGHKARYVNRMKAQLLLNTLCEYSIR